MKLSRKAQSLLEYALVLGIVASAIVLMQVYLRRGVQAKIKDMTDALLPAAAVGKGQALQLSHINKVIPLLYNLDSTQYEQNQSKDAEADVNKTVTTADEGDTLVYGTSANEDTISYIATLQPEDEVSVSPGPEGEGAGGTPGAPE